MLKKIKAFDLIPGAAKYYPFTTLEGLNFDKTHEIILNFSLIKTIDIVKTKTNKTVWKVNLTDEDALFVAPFKL